MRNEELNILWHLKIVQLVKSGKGKIHCNIALISAIDRLRKFHNASDMEFVIYTPDDQSLFCRPMGRRATGCDLVA